MYSEQFISNLAVTTITIRGCIHHLSLFIRDTSLFFSNQTVITPPTHYSIDSLPRRQGRNKTQKPPEEIADYDLYSFMYTFRLHKKHSLQSLSWKKVA